MTIHLYYEDAYLKDFDATVVGSRRIGGRPVVLLDRTAFYPTSGGQPHDTGSLESASVLDVAEDESGDILHFLDRELPAGAVRGSVDWNRRFDHMQQHTGQHILSQAFLKLAGAQTIGFHLGKETSTVDLDQPVQDADLIGNVEELCTQILFENRPVHILTVDKGQLHSLGVRKESGREGPIRVIDVEAFDRSPCGGTHVRRTGEIGVMLILAQERYKGGTRIEFVAGRRAFSVFRKEHQVLWELGRLFSSHPYDLPPLAGRLIAERAEMHRENNRLREQILQKEAEEMLRRADKVGEIAIVRGVFSDRKIEDLKLLAQILISRPQVVAILASGLDTPVLVVARGSGAPGDCGIAIKGLAGRLEGRGGGRPHLAQAGGMPAGQLEGWLSGLEEYFRSLVAEGS